MEIVFLGTSGMQPTKERGLMSIYISHGAENILVDCGEGTQRQMRIAGLKPTRLTRIFLTHLHTDHVLGVLGLLHNLDANQYVGVLEIYGPRGLGRVFGGVVKEEFFKESIRVKIHEISEGVVFDGKDIYVEAVKLSHGVLCYAYIFAEKDKRKIDLKYLKKFGLGEHPILGKLQKGEEIVWEGKRIKAEDATILVKGKRVSIILDTVYCAAAVRAAKGADLVICESTYADDNKDKAREYKHLTAKDAGRIAREGGARKLILTHFSQRYKDTKEMVKEAKSEFRNVSASEDFMKLNV